MTRRPSHRDFACLPALLVVLATSWVSADEPFPFPAPPLRSKPVYLVPDQLPALPAPQAAPAAMPQPAATTPQPRLSPISAIKKTQAVQEVAPQPQPQGGLVPPARKSVIADTAETDRRVERLKRQLEELNEMLSRPPVEPPVIERTIVNPFSQPTPSSQPTSPETEAPFSATESHSSKPPAVPESTHHEPAHTEQTPEPHAPPAAESAKPLSTSLIKGLPVSAIDRVYVADNLFAAAEYLLANDIYLQVDRRAISGDESGWVEFQLANCSRRLGRLDDAKKRYRRVVSDPTLGWLQDMAKWRLDAIDEREQLVKEHARLDAAIKQYTEVPRATAKQ
jgi:hypothetical protein